VKGEMSAMKKSLGRIATWYLAILLLTCPTLAASPFPDVDETARYAEAAEYLRSKEIMVGDEYGNFNPNKIVTRAEMAVIVCRMLGESAIETEYSSFLDDVPKSHWALGYIERAAELGIVSGYDHFRFGPNDPVTCEQAATIIVNAALGTAEATAAGGYPDGYWSVAMEYGLLNGISTKRVTGMTRANVAVMVYNWVQAVQMGRLHTNPTVEQKGYVKVGTYLFDEGYYEPHSLEIYRINADGTLMFTVNWYRLTGLDHVKAILNGNRATFNYSDGYTDAAGYIDFSSNGTASLTITSSSDDYLLDTGCSVFRFTSKEDLKLNEELYLLGTLLQNTDRLGWIGTTNFQDDNHIFYNKYYLRFYENNSVKIWYTESAGVDWNISSDVIHYSLDGDILSIGGYKYWVVIDHTATDWLYLTALETDPYGVDGTYEFGSDGVYEQFHLWG